MGRQIRPARVYQTTTRELQSALLPSYQKSAPPWYKVMEAIPPSEILTRPVPVQHRQPNLRVAKPNGIYRPQKIRYEEDHLRDVFYKDHPWELARPRIVLELDGKDAQRCDWGKGLRQPGVQLSGEW
jgi:small subunit ribosomal protein S23